MSQPATPTTSMGLLKPTLTQAGDVAILGNDLDAIDKHDHATSGTGGVAIPRVNLLVNGGFEIWQRGSGAFTTNGAYTADRWRIALGSGSTLSVSKDVSNQDAGSSACAALTYGHSAATHFEQYIEDYVELAGKTLSLSVRVKTSTASAVRASIWDTVNGAHFSSYHSGSGSYETLTVTATVATATTSVDVLVSLEVSCTAYVDNAMLTIGSTASAYFPLMPADEWERCQRYYELIGAANDGTVMFGGYCLGSGSAEWPVPFRTQKATAPTVTINGTWTLTGTTSQPTLPVGSSIYGTTVRVPNSSASAQYCAARNVGSGANITAEANP
ncbi:MAG: hypothetical protein KGL39_05495 [Patescibacteria group bacterium]|nr:hypothetical protein [Patescibacteria group bacterium]